MNSDNQRSQEDQDDEPILRAGPAHRSDDIMVWVHVGDIIAEGFSFDPARDPDDKHPTVVLKRMTAQQLFDDLWAMGFRPEPKFDVRLSADVTGAVDAMDRLQAVNESLGNRMAVAASSRIPLGSLVPPFDVRKQIEENPIRSGRTLRLCEPVTLTEAIAGDISCDIGDDAETESHS